MMARTVDCVRRHWIAGLMVLNLTIALLLVVDLFFRVGQPFGGFLIEWSTGFGTYKVSHYTPDWWPGVLHSGLKGNDDIERIAGQPFDRNHEAIFQRLQTEGSLRTKLLVRRAGVGQIEVSVPVVPFGLGHIVDFKVSEFINGLCYWLLALIIYRSRREDPVNRAAAVAASLMGASQWHRHYTPFSPNDPIFVFAEVTWNAAVIFLSPVIIRFGLLFTGADISRRRNVFRLAFVMAAVATVCVGALKIFLWSQPEYWTARVGEIDFTTLNILALSAYGVGFGFFIVRFAWTFARTTSRRLRRQLVILFVGMAVTFVAFTREGFIVPESTNGATRFYVLNGLDLRVLQLGIPLAFTVAIVRYQTLRTTSPLFTFVLVLASSALVADVGSWLIRLSTTSPDLFRLPPFVPFFGITFAVSSAWAAQPFLRGVFGRLFQWESRGLESMRRFGQRLVRQTGQTDLFGQIVRGLVDELKLEQAAILVWDDAERCYRLAAQTSPSPLQVDCLREEDGAAPLRMPVRIGTDASDAPPWLLPLRDNGFEAVAPLMPPPLTSPTEAFLGEGVEYNAGRLGLLALGKRWDEEIFHERDVEIITLIAQQVSLFLLTAQQIEELRQVPRRVTEAQERERARLARELHDTIQQFLGGLPFYLETSRKVAHIDLAQSDAILRECLSDARRAAETVRQIRSELSPIQIESSLIRSLQELIRHFQSRNRIGVQLECLPEIDGYLIGGARHELYRVVQQALDNIAAHAHATRVHVSIQPSSQRVAFTIVDDGIGFSETERASAAAEGHYGLISMRSRVTSAGGDLRVISSPGAGTTVSGWLPVHGAT